LGCDEKLTNNPQISHYQKDQIIEMVLSGHINKHIVAKLCDNGCFAVGISGKDGNLMQAKKSKLFYKRAIDQGVIDINFISEPIVVNAEILLSFEDSNIIPVISPIANDENGRTHLLDINLTASVIASSLGADHLILPQDEYISSNQDLIIQDAQVLRHMLQIEDNKPSSLLRSALYALENNTNCVHLIDASIYDSVLSSIFLN
jgi:acetylglutamate kinase